jgi:hypothetical protein
MKHSSIVSASPMFAVGRQLKVFQSVEDILDERSWFVEAPVEGVWLFYAALIVHGARMLLRRSAATKVMVFQCPCGTRPIQARAASTMTAQPHHLGIGGDRIHEHKECIINLPGSRFQRALLCGRMREAARLQKALDADDRGTGSDLKLLGCLAP